MGLGNRAGCTRRRLHRGRRRSRVDGYGAERLYRVDNDGQQPLRHHMAHIVFGNSHSFCRLQHVPDAALAIKHDERRALSGCQFKRMSEQGGLTRFGLDVNHGGVSIERAVRTIFRFQFNARSGGQTHMVQKRAGS